MVNLGGKAKNEKEENVDSGDDDNFTHLNKKDDSPIPQPKES